MSLLDRILLLVTGLTALYLTWRFYTRYSKEKKLYDIYYMMGFLVLLVSGLILIWQGWGALASPYVLTVATLIPLGISMGLMNQYFPNMEEGLLLVRPDRPSGDRLYQHYGARPEEVRRTHIPWRRRLDHLLGTFLGEG